MKQPRLNQDGRVTLVPGMKVRGSMAGANRLEPKLNGVDLYDGIVKHVVGHAVLCELTEDYHGHKGEYVWAFPHDLQVYGDAPPPRAKLPTVERHKVKLSDETRDMVRELGVHVGREHGLEGAPHYNDIIREAVHEALERRKDDPQAKALRKLADVTAELDADDVNRLVCAASKLKLADTQSKISKVEGGDP